MQLNFTQPPFKEGLGKLKQGVRRPQKPMRHETRRTLPKQNRLWKGCGETRMPLQPECPKGMRIAPNNALDAVCAVFCPD